MKDDTQVNDDLRALVAVCFAVNLPNMLDKIERLESLCRLARIPPERVPAVEKALRSATFQTLNG